jgi:hypothetical protein
MIVPVRLAAFGELPGELVVGSTSLVRKAELHYTVFNYGIGKLLKHEFQSQPRLETAINEAAATFDWSWTVGDRYYHLVQDTPGKPVLQTVIVTITAPIARFYRKTRELIGEDAAEDPELLALREKLTVPPPPHITLYTSDPSGRAGIGLNTVAELDAAIALGGTPAAPPGLRASELAPELVQSAAGRGTNPAP